MAEKYGTTPAALLHDTIGDWSFNLSCYQRDINAQALEAQKASMKAGGGSKRAPAWNE